jgi:hypothetical protein
VGALRDALARPPGLLALAAAALAGAIMDTVGFFGPGALAMASLSAALAIAASLRARREVKPDPGAVDALSLLLRLLVAVFLGYEILKSWRSAGALVLLAAAVVLLALEWRAAGPARPAGAGARARLWLWCACAAALVVRDVRARDGSFIDVWVFQQDASAALLRGENPYSNTYRNIYGDMKFYGEGVADARRVRAYPYPPQTIAVDLPAFALFGDVRYALLAALLVSAWALAKLAPLGLGSIAAAAILFHPGTLRVLRSAWTEPALLAPLFLLLVAVRRLSAAPPRGWVAAGVTGALAAGAKQYSPLLLAPLLAALPPRGRLRAAVLAAGLAAAAVVPFALWDPKGLWDGVVAMQFRQPFRSDALSWPAAFVRLGLPPPSGIWGFLATAAALALCWPRRRSLPQAVTCGAAAFLVFLLGAKQAFLNYYWLADGLLLAAALLQAGEERGRGCP